MASRRDYSRDYSRNRSSNRRREPEIDAIAVALTAQIILCILLLLGVGIIKGVHREGYESFKEEFDDLVNNPGEETLSDYFQQIGDMGRDFFSSVESMLQQVFGGGTPEDTEPPSPPQPELSFDYGYLSAGNRTTGEIPYQMSSASQRMEAPANASLAPVYLMGHVKPPVTGRVTSSYAYRVHPISGNTDFHNGIDVAAGEGRSILAALPGEVEEVGESDIYGNYIILRHAPNLQTFYAHCSQVIAREGMQVRQGERIAKVGSTGMVTGPHLHFSVLVEELYTDPFYMLVDSLEPYEA